MRTEHSTGQFSSNGLRPPLRHSDGLFDFVFSISLFTYLPEDMIFEWLDELRRVTKTGGLVALSVHGVELIYNLSNASNDRHETIRLSLSCRL
jgi:hypothetical protein